MGTPNGDNRALLGVLEESPRQDPGELLSFDSHEGSSAKSLKRCTTVELGFEELGGLCPMPVRDPLQVGFALPWTWTE